MGGAIRDNLKAEQMEKFPNHFSVTNKSPPENRPLISKRPQNKTTVVTNRDLLTNHPIFSLQMVSKGGFQNVLLSYLVGG